MFSFGSAPDSPAPPASESVPGTGPLRALFKTTMGDIEVEFYEAEAPRTVANFVGLATGAVEWTDPSGRKTKTPLYDGTIFHRVIKDFMIQGGDPLGQGTGGPGYKWKDEAAALKIKHDRPGLLSMANAGPNTNGSQFFLTEIATPWLDGKHAVFGKVIAGMDLVPKITRVPQNQSNKPLTPVKLTQVVVYRGARPS
jgi:peptidyl-prolyl cis-trans isomerase A (cyclophilin A)